MLIWLSNYWLFLVRRVGVASIDTFPRLTRYLRLAKGEHEIFSYDSLLC
jgi:hypothetical protein